MSDILSPTQCLRCRSRFTNQFLDPTPDLLAPSFVVEAEDWTQGAAICTQNHFRLPELSR
jgi:hypothetical protein